MYYVLIDTNGNYYNTFRTFSDASDKREEMERFYKRTFLVITGTAWENGEW